MKTVKKIKDLKDIQKLGKDKLINELLQKSLKGGCCSRGFSGGLGL